MVPYPEASDLETAARQARTPAAFAEATKSAAISSLDGPARQPSSAWPKVIRHLTEVSELRDRPGLVAVGTRASNWPARSTDRYAGPWNAKTRTPILLIGTQYDPNTSYRNAQRAEHRLGNAVLLTRACFGHLSFKDPSNPSRTRECATSLIWSPRHLGRSEPPIGPPSPRPDQSQP